jgi:hypothetical protein
VQQRPAQGGRERVVSRPHKIAELASPPIWRGHGGEIGVLLTAVSPSTPFNKERGMTTSHQKEQAERRALAGSTATMSYHTRAAAELQLEQGNAGRWTDKAALSGREPFVKYPAMPEGSPWAGDLSGVEPPLGYAIEAQEVTGEPHEVAASLNTALPNHDGEVVAATAEGSPSSPSAGAREASVVACLAADASHFFNRGRKL